MVAEAEQYAEQDRKERERVEAKNGLESYAYQVRCTKCCALLSVGSGC